MKRIGLVIALALVGFACADGVGQILVDAGNMIGDGSVPDAGADFEVTCDESETVPWGDGSQTHRWAEFEVDPGQTEVTVCRQGTPSTGGVSKRDTCWRSKANWIRGTSTGVVGCGWEVFDADGTQLNQAPDPLSITVHR